MLPLICLTKMDLNLAAQPEILDRDDGNSGIQQRTDQFQMVTPAII